MKKKYPLLFRVAQTCVIGNCDQNSCNTLNSDLAKELANYINMVDVYA
jgi:hypothetical protein